MDVLINKVDTYHRMYVLEMNKEDGAERFVNLNKTEQLKWFGIKESRRTKWFSGITLEITAKIIVTKPQDDGSVRVMITENATVL